LTPLQLTSLQPITAGTLAALKRHWPAVAVVGGGVLLVDSLHGPLSSLLSLSAAAGGLWLLSGRLRPSPLNLPASSEGWLERLEGVLQAFERLEAGLEAESAAGGQDKRRQELLQLQQRQGRRHLELALVGSAGCSAGIRCRRQQGPGSGPNPFNDAIT